MRLPFYPVLRKIMRKPSRLMPKYVESDEGFGPLGITVTIFVTLAIVFYLAWQVPWLLLVIPFYFAFFFILNKKWEKKFTSMLNERSNCDIGSFAKSFDYRKIDTWVIRAVYEQLQAYVSSEKAILPILASDKLFEDLEIDEEDFELDIVEEIAQRTGRSIKDCDNNPYYGNIETVSDLVHFFNIQPIEKVR